ncbi:MAG TPA: alpha/beta hydrolase [Nocardioides sp.]|uniref:alpha/beta fold hydrolase n=1 Tax=Nocardioides sp. TaxID=35761 RepID=UPI002E2F0467|nr:alpha/beta hydrolase [Nocardioides sp.]HEX5086543.1 alpha/beta hydrolase [Nocardioides sp.]
MTTLQTVAAPYDDLGAGAPSLLLVPGWCGDRSVFGPLAAELAADHRVVVAELRGQGALSHLSEDFDTARQVDDLLALVDELGLETVVPVALSHAGWMAIEMRRRLGATRVPGIVLLDWMVLGTPPGFTEALEGLQDAEAWQSVRAGLFEMWTAGVASQSVHDYVGAMGRYDFAHWSRAGREIAAAFVREASPLAALGRLAEPCPTLHLYAQPADDGYLTAQQEAAARLGWFQVERIAASSHFPMLEVPGSMAETVREFSAGPARRLVSDR